MNIALFHELDTGGARRAANEFSKALRNNGHSVDLFIVDSKENKDDMTYYSKINFYQFYSKEWKGRNWKIKLYKDTVELYKLYILHKRIAKDIQNGKYDFVFVHGSKFTQAPFILRFLKIRTLYYCQEPLRMIYETLFAPPKNLSLIRATYEKVNRMNRKYLDILNIRKADKILANSTYTYRNILLAYGLPSTICYMGVDTTFFCPTLSKDMDIFFIGSKEKYDGYALFQEALSQMKKKANVLYLLRGERYVTDAQLRDYYSRSKIVICFGYNEPFGLIPLEAMACGATVVALDEGGYKDSVKQNITGLLVEKDPRKIAQLLDAIIDDNSLLKKFSYAGMSEVRAKWQWNIAAKRIVEEARLLH